MCVVKLLTEVSDSELSSQEMPPKCPAMLRQEGLCRLGAKVSQIFCQYQTDSCSQKQKFSILLNNNNEDDNTNNNTNVQAILSREDLCRRQGNSYMPVKLAKTYQME